jgi:hypothetical protein
LHQWSVRQTRKRQSPGQHSPPPLRPAAGDGWFGRVNAQKAGPDTIAVGRAASRVRESGLVRRPITRRKMIGAIERAPTTRGPPPRRHARNCPAGETLRRVKSHERCRLAGHPTEPARPARRRKIARAETGTPGYNRHCRGECLTGLGDPAPEATADASDRVMTPNALSPASRPRMPGGKPQGRADVT